MATSDEIQELLNYFKANANSAKNPNRSFLLQQSAQNPNYMAQYAIGNLLNQGFQSWKKNYDERGRLKGETQQKLLGDFKTQYGDHADAVVNDLKQQGIWNSWDKLSKFDPATYSAPYERNLSKEEYKNPFSDELWG